MKMSDRMDRLESVVEKHLEESGSIRTDISALKAFAKEAKDLPSDMKWVKRAFWALIGLGSLIIGSILPVLFELMLRTH